MKLLTATLCLLLTIGLLGCTKPVAEWSESEIASWIKKEWRLSEVTATAIADGTFSAKGTNDAGTEFTFRVAKKPEVKELHCIRLSGDVAMADGMVIKDY